MIVREATEADLEALVEGNLGVATETEDKQLDRATLTAGVAAGLADRGKARYFVAELDGRVAGMCMITYEWSDWRNGWIWWFQSVYVWAAYRRRGVFRAICEHVKATAEQEGVVGMRLYVDQDNQVARHVYEQLGLAPGRYLVHEGGFR